ncbi:MAG TPA: hypothetical protein VIM16_14230 [Mucilaginibacter sp.]|jgi:MFS superfamily sulfate permease-like transporter
MKFISPKNHGIIDYLVIVFLLVSPSYFGFTGLLAAFTYALAGVHLLLTICTDYAPGIFKVIPFPVHGSIEFIVGIVLIVLAYTLFNKEADGKLFYVIFGTVILLTWLVTDYRGIYQQNTG